MIDSSGRCVHAIKNKRWSRLKFTARFYHQPEINPKMYTCTIASSAQTA